MVDGCTHPCACGAQLRAPLPSSAPAAASRRAKSVRRRQATTQTRLVASGAGEIGQQTPQALRPRPKKRVLLVVLLHKRPSHHPLPQPLPRPWPAPPPPPRPLRASTAQQLPRASSLGNNDGRGCSGDHRGPAARAAAAREDAMERGGRRTRAQGAGARTGRQMRRAHRLRLGAPRSPSPPASPFGRLAQPRVRCDAELQPWLGKDCKQSLPFDEAVLSPASIPSHSDKACRHDGRLEWEHWLRHGNPTASTSPAPRTPAAHACTRQSHGQ